MRKYHVEGHFEGEIEAESEQDAEDNFTEADIEIMDILSVWAVEDE